MKMDISEWANHNNMTPEEFKNEIAATMAAIGGIELDGSDNKDNGNVVVFTVEDDKYRHKIAVYRTSL